MTVLFTDRIGRGLTYAAAEGVFPVGTDSLLLSSFVCLPDRPCRVCDLGCGGGVLALLLAERRPDAEFLCVDISPLAVEAAAYNTSLNGLDGRVKAVEADARVLPEAGFNAVVSNPPYFRAGAGAPCADGLRDAARSGLEPSELCAAACRALLPRGSFSFCCRPERLAGYFAALKASGLEPKRLAFASHSASEEPFLALIEAVKGAKPALRVLPTIIPSQSFRG